MVALGAYRLAHPAHVHGALVVIVAAAGLLGNAVAALLLREHTEDLNFKAVALHFTGDAAAALGVIVAGTVILATGRFEAIDPIVGLLITVLIGTEALAARARAWTSCSSRPHPIWTSPRSPRRSPPSKG